MACFITSSIVNQVFLHIASVSKKCQNRGGNLVGWEYVSNHTIASTSLICEAAFYLYIDKNLPDLVHVKGQEEVLLFILVI